jgi:YidC/Oxa1 family membrane protein insertase
MAHQHKSVPTNTPQVSGINNNQLLSTPSTVDNNTSSNLSSNSALNTLSCFSVKNDVIDITWNKNNGAILQVTWQDGTPFFPKLGTSESTNSFPGISVASHTVFNGNPTVVTNTNNKEVVFHSKQGDKLVYKIPNQGPIVFIEWTSPTRSVLNLIPKPQTLEVVKDLGRVFAITPNKIKKETWESILKDPFFHFIGMKRSSLPSATRWVGIDAGVDPSKTKRVSHHFAAIWETYQDIQCDNDGVNPGYSLTVDSNKTVYARLYLGPKQAKSLALFDTPGNKDNYGMFKQVVDFGSFGLVAKLLFVILHSIFYVVHNWGIAIILLVILIRGVLWPLNTKVTIQMLRMKELEPFQKKLQAKYEKFGNDLAKKAEMQKELMAFYKKNKHNPMGACLPSLLQAPVFFALWSMLGNVFELRHAKFALWLVDLSSRDPYFILPLLMWVSMIIQQLMTPATGDPMQRKIMIIIMPAIMSLLFINFPSGLCLYYLVFNIIGIFQSWLVMKRYKPQPIMT